MSAILADVNVWLATVVENHPHHAAAARWWSDEVLSEQRTVGFCWLTRLGLLRLLSSERVMGRRRLDHVDAWRICADLLEQRPVMMLREPAGIDALLGGIAGRQGSSPNFWSDAYLTGFARAGGHQLATFDRGFRRFDGLDLRLLR